ncbi:TIGR02285 family protein [Pseudomonas sp. YuFO20]|uniref:TIGR02285 family protein n=1 Tax=Pseudomonas TaxID=286 RepID=UPI0023642DF7|nr:MULTISPECIES: TIGR02285 family protein [Pseudomonas]MDD2103500.1 TIGR02285 family protein [Pseudomonas putida]MEB2515638.1 TIGR02285 family protein [Pseudomonas sp. YuFO20]
MTRRRLHSCAKTEPSELKRLFARLIKPCLLLDGRRLGALASLLLIITLAAPVSAQAKDSLVWLKRDLPPLFIFDGPQKGQGVIDQLLRQLIAGMPQYQHSVLKVNRARGLQMLHEPALTCDAALNWSKERESWIAFSLPVFRAMSNGLAIRRNDREVLTPFLKDGEVDLAALLATGSVTLGIVAERNYGDFLDTLLKQAPGKVLTSHYGNDALGSLLQMQRLGRLQLLLGYRPEIRYQAQQQGIAEDELEFFPIRGTGKYLSGYIGCTNTPQGRQAIVEINQLLRALPRDHLSEAYAGWLDPQSRSDYLQAARDFFEHQSGY